MESEYCETTQALSQPAPFTSTKTQRFIELGRERKWRELCESVRKAMGIESVQWEYEDKEYRERLILLAEIYVKSEGKKEVYKVDIAPQVDVDLLALECIQHCVLTQQEDLACGCLELFTQELPLHLVHRAGEHGMFRFLMMLHRLQVAIKSNRVIASIPSFIQRRFRRSSSSGR